MPEEKKEKVDNTKKTDTEPKVVETPKPQKTNTISVVGLISAFFLPLIGLICSTIGVFQTSKHQEKGKGLAIAGIIISILNGIFQIVMAIIIIAAVIANQTLALDTYTNANPSYAIKYPKGWVKETKNQDTIQGYVFKDELNDNTDKVKGQTEIAYVPAPAGGYNQDILNALRDGFKQEFNGSVVEYESRDTYYGLEGLRFIITYNGENGKIKAKITLVQNSDKSVYIIATQAPVENYDKYSDAFDEIHATFQP